MLESICGFAIPHGEGGGSPTLQVPVPGLDQLTFQEWAVWLPSRLYGWGLHSLRDTCGPAYLGALETAIPFIAGRGKLCLQMADTWGGEEQWGEASPVNRRWLTLLQSGC